MTKQHFFFFTHMAQTQNQESRDFRERETEE